MAPSQLETDWVDGTEAKVSRRGGFLGGHFFSQGISVFLSKTPGWLSDVIHDADVNFQIIQKT